MSRSYRMISYLEVEAKLPQEDCGFTYVVLYPFQFLFQG
jgi:hypothetical protein